MILTGVKTFMNNTIEIRRKVEQELLRWKLSSEGRSAALVVGARRVGKSFVVEKFAKTNYQSYILIDFSTARQEIIDLFSYQSDDLDTFFGMLQALLNIRLFERNSVIIFDEVQLFPKAREMIKRLVADGRYDYIETGSLMSIKKNTENILIPSEEHKIDMFPLDFEEFLWALGEDMLFDIVRQSFEAKSPLGDSVHRRIMGLFRQYMVVGGMPQAVLEYARTKDFTAVDDIKHNILDLYKQDIFKHGGKDAIFIKAIYEQIPTQLAKANKRFMFSSIAEGARYREYADALLWLADSKIINICYNTTEPTVGLGMRADLAALKCYQADTGLLVSQCFARKILSRAELYQKMITGKLEFNNGMIMENVVAQMLKATGNDLYYYSETEDRMEIDFVTTKSIITSRKNIIPIEVKSGKHYLARSLEKFRNKYPQQIEKSIILHDGNVSVDNETNTIYLPVYMAGLI